MWPNSKHKRCTRVSWLIVDPKKSKPAAAPLLLLQVPWLTSLVRGEAAEIFGVFKNLNLFCSQMVTATQRLAKMKTSPSSTVKEADPRSRTPCPTSAWRTAPSPWISLLRPHQRKSLAVSGAEVPLLSGGASRLKLICLLRRLLVFKSSLETLTFCAWTPLTSRSFACFKVVLVVWGHWAPALCCSAVQWCCCVVLCCGVSRWVPVLWLRDARRCR